LLAFVIGHPEIEKLSDPIQSEMHNLVDLPKSKGETCKADAMRLSCNLAYMIAQCTTSISVNMDCTFEAYEKAGKASFEYHWNIHTHCGLWCQTKPWTEEEKLKGKEK
jgi:hypothetical protein